MTDTNRGKQALSLTLTAIMVLSMVAIGLTAFTGSAAASSASVVDGDVQATPADDDTTSAAQVAVLELDPGAISSSGEVVFNSSDTINITDATGSVDYGSVTESEVFVEFVSESGIQSTFEAQDNGDDDLEVTTAQSGSELNINHKGPDQDLQNTQFIRVVISNNVNQDTGSGTISGGLEVAYEEDGGSTARADNIDLNLDGDAPIQVDDSGTLENHTSFERAVDTIGSSTATVTINSDVDEFFSQPAVLDVDGSTNSPSQSSISSATLGSNNDVKIKGNSNEVKLVNSDAGITEALNLGGTDNPVVENVDFNSTARVSSQLQSGVVTGDATGGNFVNVSSNTFEDFSGGPVVDGSGLAGDTLVNVSGNTITGQASTGINVGQVGANSEINNNDLSDIGSNNGIIISTINADTDVLNNNISGVSGSNTALDITAGSTSEVNVSAGSSGSDDAIRTSGAATGISLDANDNSPTFNINDTEIVGDTTAADTGIDVTDTGSGDQTAFIGQSTVVSDYNTSVAAADSLESATITVTGGTTLDGLAGDGTTINAIDATNTYGSDLTLNVDDTTIRGDADTNGINLDDGGSTLNFDTSNAGSTLEGVNKGVIVTTGSLSDISNTTFTDVDNEAIDVDGAGSSLTIEEITVDGSSDTATAVAFDASQALTVRDSQLGTDSSNEVNDGVDVQSRSGEIVVNSTDIFVDGGSGINLASGNGNPLTIDGTTINGSDQTGTGIAFADGSAGTLNVNPDNAGTIQSINKGIVISAATDDSLTLGSGTDIDNFGSAGVEHTASQNLTISGAELTEDSSGGATGVDFDAADGKRLTIDSQSTIQVADDSSSTGVLIDQDGAEFDITKSTIEAVSTQSAGTGIDINDAENDPTTGTVTIQFNEIIGFNKSSGNGLAGSEASNLMNENATGNYWGTEYGPDANAGSNVSSSVANDAYDPFLTADLSTQVSNAEDVDSVSGLTESDVQDFAHGLTVGAAESFAFPATSTDTQLSDIYVDNSSNVAIYEYNATSQDWELASGRPTGLDAYVAAFGDNGDSMNVKIEYESEASAVDRGTYEYQDGFNYLPVAQENTSVTSDVINTTTGFDLTDPDKSDTRFASQYTGAANGIYSQTNYATVSGDNLGTPAPDLSPFQGTFVNIETTSVDDNQIAPLDPSVSLANANQTDA